MDARPPRLATALLRWCAPRGDAAFLVADAREEFEQIAEAQGRRAAARWYWRQAFSSALSLLRWRLDAHGFVEAAPASRATRTADSFRAGARLLVGSPGTSLAVLLTLALGIGANTAVFSVVDRVLLQPLPYPQPDRLVSVWESTRDNARLTVAPGNFADYAARVPALEMLAAYTRTAAVVQQPGAAPEEWPIDRVTHTLLPVLRTIPAMGRGFTDQDGDPGATPALLLTHRAWRDRFSSAAAVLGRTVVLNQVAHEVIGVLPADFRPPSDIGSTIQAAALVVAPRASTYDSRQDHELRAIGRLRDGATPALAQQQLDALSADLAREHPATNAHTRAWSAPLVRDAIRTVRPSMIAMMAAVAVVVLIACVNVTNLLLVWGMGRRRDVAIRLALGATRAHIVGEFLARGLLLGLAGGGLGLVIGVWTRDVLLNLAPSTMSRVGTFTLNGRVLAVTATLSIGIGAVAGLVPAAQILRRRLTPTLRATDPSASAGRSVMRWRGVLVAAEVAAAVALACGAGLLMRSLILLNRVDLGYETDRVLTMSIRLPKARYPDADSSVRFFEALAARVRAMPTVESVAFANQFPMRGGWGGEIVVDGPSGVVRGTTDLQAVSPDYFATLGIALERGRLLNDADRIGTMRVAVVSRTFVDRFAPGRDPIGVVIRRDEGQPAMTIVGVVSEIRRDGKFDPPAPQVYVPSGQIAWHPTSLAALAVRADGDPMALLAPVRAAVAAIDPYQAVTGVRTLDEILDASVATRRFNSWLYSAFAAIALALAVIGVYGIVGQMVRQRTREMAIRCALGASRHRVVGLVLRAGLGWAALGIVIGLLIVLASSRLLASLLFETAPNDPATLAAVTVLIGFVSMIASYIPARRAARADPVAILRAD